MTTATLLTNVCDSDAPAKARADRTPPAPAQNNGGMASAGRPCGERPRRLWSQLVAEGSAVSS
jgi:hypothetical protein